MNAYGNRLKRQCHDAGQNGCFVISGSAETDPGRSPNLEDSSALRPQDRVVHLVDDDADLRHALKQSLELEG
jgi:hypothetical protein